MGRRAGMESINSEDRLCAQVSCCETTRSESARRTGGAHGHGLECTQGSGTVGTDFLGKPESGAWPFYQTQPEVPAELRCGQVCILDTRQLYEKGWEWGVRAAPEPQDWGARTGRGVRKEGTGLWQGGGIGEAWGPPH